MNEILVWLRRLGLLSMLTTACGGGPPSPPTPTSPSPIPPTSGDATSFRVAVLIGSSSVPSIDQVQRVFGRANDILFEKTGERMTQTDLATVGSGSALSQAQAYVNSHASAPPDATLNFSDEPMVVNFGGVSQTFSLPSPHQNRFPSPFLGANHVYLAAVHFFHMYARCGYDGSSWLTANRIGTVSAGGECRGQSGLLCVDTGLYWRCPDSLNDLYSEQEYFIGCTVVHELMHPFGPAGAQDHYGTTTCTTRTGMSQGDVQNRHLSQQSCGLCPDVYQNFRRR